MTTYGRFPLPWNGRWMPFGIPKDANTWTLWLDTCTLGHAHPALVETVSRQIQTLHHVSNLFYIPVQGQLAKWLIEHSCAERVFFCNSELKRTKERLNWRGSTLIRSTIEQILTANASFHGRTLANYYRNGTAEVPKDFVSSTWFSVRALQRYRWLKQRSLS